MWVGKRSYIEKKEIQVLKMIGKIPKITHDSLWTDPGWDGLDFTDLVKV